MPAGLFGKLPAKRDFVALNAPRRFLDAYEPWLQGGLATARMQMGDAFAPAFNSAPLWRFWLGPDVAGEATIGAFMASVDGVGRSFPLTVFSLESGGAPPPPEVDSNDAWFEAAEHLLLGALGEGVSYDSIVGQAAALPQPAVQPPGGDLAGFRELADGSVLLADSGAQWPLGFRAAGRFAQRRALNARSFWWTLGGGDFPPLALSCPRLPPAEQFAGFLTGRFA